MIRTIRTVTLFASMLALALTSFADHRPGHNPPGQGGGGGGDEGGGTLSVDVTFRDDGGDRIKSDVMGSYRDGMGGVLAIVGLKNGGFRLDTGRAKERMVSLDFTECQTGETCTLPFAPDSQDLQDVDLRLGEKFIEDELAPGTWVPAGVKLDIVEMDGGDTARGALSINFAPTGRPSKLQYLVLFGRQSDGPLVCGDPVTVTRGGTAGSPTNSWRFSATTTDVACLYKVVDNFKEITLEGRFHLPFSIDVVEQP